MGIKEEEKQADARAQEILEESLPIKWDSKRYAVFSTRKNPDKYIERLLSRIEWLENQMDCDYQIWKASREQHAIEIARVKGEHLLTLGNASYTTNLRIGLGGKIRLDQELMIKGNVTAYTKTTDEEYPHRVTITLTDVSLKED